LVASTIAAPRGGAQKTATDYYINANTMLNISSVGEDGTILWHTNGGSNVSFRVGNIHVEVGALKPPGGSFSFLLDNTSQPRADAGASIELMGCSTIISDLLSGGGHRYRRRMDFDFPRGEFFGRYLRTLPLVFNGDASLSGFEVFVGGAVDHGCQHRQTRHGRHKTLPARPPPPLSSTTTPLRRPSAPSPQILSTTAR
jgi:hypothetical protein